MGEKQYEVMRWIEQNFVITEIQILNCGLFPYSKRIIDKKGDEMIVYYDLMTNTVKWVFPDKAQN